MCLVLDEVGGESAEELAKSTKDYLESAGVGLSLLQDEVRDCKYVILLFIDVRVRELLAVISGPILLSLRLICHDLLLEVNLLKELRVHIVDKGQQLLLRCVHVQQYVLLNYFEELNR